MAHAVLVVEGAHDASFFGQLIRARGYKRAGTLSDVPEFWMPLIPRRYPTDPAGRLDRVIQFPEIHVSNDGDTLGIIVAGGEERLIEGLRTPLEQLGPSSFAGIGMALDTDQLSSCAARFDMLVSRFSQLNADASAEGTPGFPLELPREPGVAVAGPPKLGVYLFPDNMRQGTLETVLLECLNTEQSQIARAANLLGTLCGPQGTSWGSIPDAFARWLRSREGRSRHNREFTVPRHELGRVDTIRNLARYGSTDTAARV